MAIQVVILAAGQGKRMNSRLPKVLHPIAGKPMLEHVIQTALAISPTVSPIVVYGHQGEVLRQALSHYDIHWAEQKEQLGTGHALLQALPYVSDENQILVLYGDVPLISANTLKELIATTPTHSLGMLTANLTNPMGYGRIKRDQQKNIIAIVEEKDATSEERAMTEINPGIYLAPAHLIKKWLPSIKNQNAQKEYYLTDIIPLAAKEKLSIHGMNVSLPEEIFGVNDKLQLAHLERFYQLQLAKKLLQQGVTLLDPSRLDIRGDVQIGQDVVIDVNVVMEGRVVIGDGSVIGPNTLLRDVVIGKNVAVKANSVIENAEIADHCVLGPFVRIRPGTVLASHVHIGNFVEIKNSQIDEKTKINHLSYVGDSQVGKQVNIGAGTITCNYDGVNKHKTIIGDRVMVGSDTTLVAPVTIHDDVYIAAATTVRQEVPAGSLVYNRREEVVREGWTAKRKQLETKKT